MQISRRTLMKSVVAGLGGLSLGVSPLSALTEPGQTPAFAPPAPGGNHIKRIVFYLQNHGFHPWTCVPKDLQEDCALDSFAFAEPMKALEPFKDRMHVVTGLHGRHTSPHHSAYFGGLGGYRGGSGIAPTAATIDHVFSQHIGTGMVPHLCIGMGALEQMRKRPTSAELSASGARQPILMHSNPVLLHEMIFGSVAKGDVHARYEAKLAMFKKIEQRAVTGATDLSGAEAQRYATHVNGYRALNQMSEDLSQIPDILKKFAPAYDGRYTNPKHETDWHDLQLNLGIAALQAGLTNVLTIASGGGGVSGTWAGLGVKATGHQVGHCTMYEAEHWHAIRQYNCRMLIQLMKSLEAIPEGDGTMMDSTLIVYTSANGAEQHTSGDNWPMVLLGNGGGSFATGRYTHVDDRPVNDFYTTLLRGLNLPIDRFNLSEAMAGLTGSQAGPIERLLA